MNDRTSDRVVQGVHAILMNQLEVKQDQLIPEARIMADLGADSLDVVEINMKLEESFTLTIPDEQVEEVETVGELCNAVAELIEDTGRTA